METTKLNEREVLIKAFSDVSKEFEGRKWIMDGRGCYSFDDDEYRKEVSYLFESFEKIKSEMWSNIKSKTFEYKNNIEAPLLSKISDMQKMLEKVYTELYRTDNYMATEVKQLLNELNKQ